MAPLRCQRSICCFRKAHRVQHGTICPQDRACTQTGLAQCSNNLQGRYVGRRNPKDNVSQMGTDLQWSRLSAHSAWPQNGRSSRRRSCLMAFPTQECHSTGLGHRLGIQRLQRPGCRSRDNMGLAYQWPKDSSAREGRAHFFEESVDPVSRPTPPRRVLGWSSRRRTRSRPCKCL